MVGLIVFCLIGAFNTFLAFVVHKPVEEDITSQEEAVPEVVVETAKNNNNHLTVPQWTVGAGLDFQKAALPEKSQYFSQSTLGAGITLQKALLEKNLRARADSLDHRKVFKPFPLYRTQTFNSFSKEASVPPTPVRIQSAINLY